MSTGCLQEVRPEPSTRFCLGVAARPTHTLKKFARLQPRQGAAATEGHAHAINVSSRTAVGPLRMLRV